MKNQKAINKKIKKIIIVIILINLLNPYRAIAANNIIKRGDCNGDGTIDITDVVKILRHDASNKTSGKENWKLTQEEIKRADVNNDGKADISDVLHILRYISAKSDEETRKKHPDWITKLEDTNQEDEKNKEIQPQAIVLDKTGLTLDITKNPQGKLNATITPSNTNSKNKITWKSSNEGIAKVDQNGMVTGIKDGEATITVSTENGKTANCKVTVKNQVINVNSIVIDKTSLNLEKDEIVKLKATIQPTNATNKTITWKSSNNKVAIVNNDGTVKAIAAGSATITAQTSNGKIANCTVKVIDSIVKKLDGKNVTLPLGDKVYFLDTQFIGSNERVSANDCIIIESNGKYGMIDTATSRKSSRVIKYLKELKIKELEFVLITHDHSDHIGGFIDISNKVKIKKLYIKQRSNVRTTKAVKQAKKKGIKICYVGNAENQKITLGNINFKLYNTSDNIGNKKNIDENVNSVVALANINGQAVYFTGDIGNYSGINAENTVAKQIQKDLKSMGKDKIDVYKAAHHLYLQNNSATALKYLQPRNVVVTNTKNRSSTKSGLKRVKDYVDKAKGKMYFTYSGTTILNITRQGKITFKQLANYY